ncbi:MAG TPA: M20/M25/M40 family metallo-hydrolase, partial [Thermoanaerobaculia bacterium]
AGIGVGVCSSVIPYVCDQLAMARLPRATFALLLSLLPASSTAIGWLVLRQVPTIADLMGTLLVAVGVAIHQERNLDRVRKLMTAAAESSQGYETLAYLSDNIGPRLSGSKGAAMAVQWTTERFRSWGIDVRQEKVMVPHWVRGAESALLVSHNDQRLALTTLGGSVATPPEGIVTDVIEATSFDELSALGRQVAGKIVFLNRAMDMTLLSAGRALDSYRRAQELRARGADRASQYGAVAVVIRSVGSASLRTPHTGSVVYEGAAVKIPAAALAAEDAMLIHRLLVKGDRVSMHLLLRPRIFDDVESANVVAEIRGGECPDEIVLLGAHLDSWDVGTGAIDNGAGVTMVMESVRLIHELDLAPKRTIRAVLFMNEENGGRGARQYFTDHENERHIAAIETDSGAAAPLGFVTTLNGVALSDFRRGVRIAKFEYAEDTGVDTRPFIKAGVTGFGLVPDQRHYFDYHHSAADTLDKIDPHELAQNTAALAALTYVIAETGVPSPR